MQDGLGGSMGAVWNKILRSASPGRPRRPTAHLRNLGRAFPGGRRQRNNGPAQRVNNNVRLFTFGPSLRDAEEYLMGFLLRVVYFLVQQSPCTYTSLLAEESK